MRRNKQENNVVQKCNTSVKQKRAISPIYIAIAVLVCLAIALVLVLVIANNDTAPPLVYTSNGDGTCYVSGIARCTDTNVVIPSVSPDGDTVTGIGDCAFYECTSLTSVTIPEGVTSIGGEAFEYCTSLTSIAFAEGSQLTTIGRDRKSTRLNSSHAT